VKKIVFGAAAWIVFEVVGAAVAAVLAWRWFVA
jgi:hypothetical protein